MPALEAEDRRGTPCALAANHIVCVVCATAIRVAARVATAIADEPFHTSLASCSHLALRVAAPRRHNSRPRPAPTTCASRACPPNSSAPASAASWRWCGSWRRRASASSRSASASRLPGAARDRGGAGVARQRDTNTSRMPGFRRSATRSPRTTPSAPTARSPLKMSWSRTARCSRSRRHSWRCSSRATKFSCPTRAFQTMRRWRRCWARSPSSILSALKTAGSRASPTSTPWFPSGRSSPWCARRAIPRARCSPRRSCRLRRLVERAPDPGAF